MLVENSPDIDTLIDETEKAVENTRSFLQNLTEAAEKEYVEDVQHRYEKHLENLRRKRDNEAQHQEQATEQPEEEAAQA